MASSGASFADIPASALSKLNLTADKSCCSASAMGSCPGSQSGTTCEHSTENHGGALLTSCVVGSHARTSALPDTRPALTESGVDYGRKCGESLAKYNPDSHSWKTRQILLFSAECESLQTLPPWGLAVNGELWALDPLVVYAKARDCGFSLLRPTAQCWKAWTFQHISSLIRKNHADGNIQEQSARCFRKMITPLSNEILMMWPEGWTDLKPLATDRCQDAPLSPGEYFQKWIEINS